MQSSGEYNDRVADEEVLLLDRVAEDPAQKKTFHFHVVLKKIKTNFKIIDPRRLLFYACLTISTELSLI